MLTELGHIIYEDKERVISVATAPDGIKEYRIEQKHRPCYYCKKSVRKESGGWLKHPDVVKLMKPKYFCRTHYIELKQLLKSLKPKRNRKNDFYDYDKRD